MPAPGASAKRLLTKHFFESLFDTGELSGGARSSVPAMIAGACGVFLAVGCLLARVYLKKYTILGDEPTGDLYQQAVLGDAAFLIAVPMWVVALVAVLVGPSMFPDEMDFRVLTGLPITKHLIFTAKLMAVLRFMAVFAVAAHVALLPLLFLISVNPWSTHGFPIQLLFYLAASLPASLFAVLAVAAIRALLLLAVPRAYLLTTSAAVGSIQLFALITAVPFIGLFPGAGRAFAAHAAWLAAAPPAWFAGIQRALMGDGRFIDHAAIGLAALAAVAAIAATAYVILYRHFDRVILRPALGGRRRAAPTGQSWTPGWLASGESRVMAAVRDFALITIRRSAVHQGVLVTITAVGVAVIAFALFAVDLSPTRPSGIRYRNEIIARIPFMLVFAAGLAARATLLVPIELRANWIFRITERPFDRVDRIGAAVSTIRRLGVLAPVMLTLPLEWYVFGPSAIAAAGVTILCGFLFVEFILRGWRRVPFTCSYITGKAFVPQLVIVGFFSFFFFTSFGAQLSLLVMHSPAAALLWLTPVVAALLVMRRNRIQAWLEEEAQFEDALPNETHALRLSGY
jgi:hypothetical protein